MPSRIGWFLLWAAAGSSALGCAARVADDSRLAAELARMRQQALVSELRLAELERRLVDVQQESTRRAAEEEAQRQISSRLDLLLVQNQRLLQQSGAPPAGDPVATKASLASPGSCSEELEPEEQLRRSVERLQQDPRRWHGGLTPEQNRALNSLLRRRRPLDRSNPWDS